MVEKRGVIEEGRTPPETTAESPTHDKEAARRVEEHATRRLADAAAEALRRN